MKIGYLHTGESTHGVCRYGHMLADEGRRRKDLQIVETELQLSGDWSNDGPAIDRAAQALAGVDLVHIQYNRAVWGDGWYQLRTLRHFIERCPAPIFTSLHDVYPSNPWSAWRRSRSKLKQRWNRFRYHLTHRVPSQRATRLLMHRAAAVLVCFDCERDRLRDFSNRGRIEVVGHFVESRSPLPDRDTSRKSLGVDGRRVVTLLGYIHRRKGHDLAVAALEQLPEDVLMAFVGASSARNERELEKLVKRAHRLGVADRLRVTGYVPESELEQWLVATDLAICPFRFLSASGSITTWISAGRPVLAYDLPQIAEYRRVSPDAFDTFSPFESEALARGIVRQLEESSPGRHPGVMSLAERFSLARIFNDHLEAFRRTLNSLPSS